jgi:uncharacterized protein
MEHNTFELSVEVSEPYPFTSEALEHIQMNTWVRNQWPLVYFIQNAQRKEAYVGESTNALSRIKNHLANRERTVLNTISIIGSDKFNKSATLDMEANLIQYITAEGVYKLQNGNYGLINHNYYQQDLYKNLFREVWSKLMERKIVSKSLEDIENSELFKYSPFKSLNQDQYHSVMEILAGLTQKSASHIVVQGTAGTGKTILATYLIKLLCTNLVSDADLNEDELREHQLIQQFQKKYPKPKIGLVIAMTSLRETLKKVFKSIPGLKNSMVMAPSDVVKYPDKYDLLIVDEAHRLRQFKNISWMGTFRENNQLLDLDDSGTELDWIMKKSKNQIFFYDAAQSVKPSDVDGEAFENLLNHPKTLKLELQSQMRVKGGNNYIRFVDQLLNGGLKPTERYEDGNYELQLFDNFQDLYTVLTQKEQQYQLCRVIAGYSWPWVSKGKADDPETHDINLDGLSFKWNTVASDWINAPNAFQEIGCIHTTQGYDLNYAAIVFGYEIDYDPAKNRIIIHPNHYHDRNGKAGVEDQEMLREYIINIYKTIMYRGIRGTYIYACNPNMREYLRKHVNTWQRGIPFRVLKQEDVKPHVNAVPLLDITPAAGNFSDTQLHTATTWIELPKNIAVKKGYFVCRVEGESMNKKIPNGAYCLFEEYTGGSREGQIVLVQSTSIQDADFGSGYTVKQYHSEKNVGNETWEHSKITLRPLSNNPQYTDIKLEDDAQTGFKVVGIFKRILA